MLSQILEKRGRKKLYTLTEVITVINEIDEFRKSLKEQRQIWQGNNGGQKNNIIKSRNQYRNNIQNRSRKFNSNRNYRNNQNERFFSLPPQEAKTEIFSKTF